MMYYIIMIFDKKIKKKTSSMNGQGWYIIHAQRLKLKAFAISFGGH